MNRISKMIAAIGFLLTVFGFAVAFLLLPDRPFSEQENRGLSLCPQFTLEKLVTGAYSQEINDYFADQFPMRDALVWQKGIAELTLGKGENDGVLIGDGGQLAKRLFSAKAADGTLTEETDAFDPAHIQASMEGVNRLASKLDVPLTVLLTGRTLDVAASAFSYPRDFSDALLTCVRDHVADNVVYLDTVPHFRELYDRGEYVYYKTDHHWTTLGAYYAYCEIMRSFGMESEILPESFFVKETSPEPFFGTAWSAGGMKFVPPDRLELWHGADDGAYTVTADGKTLDGFYQRAHLTKKDQYSVFLDGVHDVVTVQKNGEEERPTLLLFKDSFANSIAPFLARHFDLVLLNLSSTKTDFTNASFYAKQYGADRVLLLYTLENVITADRLCRLR